MSQKISYCYALLDPRKPATYKGQYRYGAKINFSHEPFYVGLGRDRRSETHVRKALWKTNEGSYRATDHKSNKIRKIMNAGLEVIVVRTSSLGTVEQAKELECKLIRLIGRYDQGTGPLVNGTDGGDGATNPSPRSRKRMSEFMKAIERTPEWCAKIGEANRHRTYTDETKAKIGAASRKRKADSEETRYAKGSARRGRKMSESFCSKLRKALMLSNGKKVRVGRRIFNTCAEASKYLGITPGTLTNRLKSPNFPDIDYV